MMVSEVGTAPLKKPASWVPKPPGCSQPLNSARMPSNASAPAAPPAAVVAAARRKLDPPPEPNQPEDAAEGRGATEPYPRKTVDQTGASVRPADCCRGNYYLGP